jgi:Tfp pilus assembly protein PilX
MRKQTEVIEKRTGAPRARDAERGAALITVVLMSMMLLTAGLGLIAVTSNSASLAADATSEAQAYYAAEAGAQAVLGALRGNDAPSPLFNGTPSNDANKMTFRKAITLAQSNSTTDTYSKARLSRWLGYTGTAYDGTSVVPINANYAAGSGMAYSVEEVKDPDNSDIVIFSTSGKFDNNTPTKDYTCASGCATVSPTPVKLTITYAPRGSTSVFTTTSGATNLGSFTLSANNNGTFTVNDTLTLTLTQTKPWAATKAIRCTITGTITKSAGGWSGSGLTISLPTLTHSLDAVIYTLNYAGAPNATVTNGTPFTVSATVTPPDPQRLRVRIKGYGPRNAVKMIQMLIGMASLDYNAASTIALRSADDGSTMTGNIGSSAVYNYNGNDNANGASLPAFTVTGAQDAAFINTALAAGSQVQGYPVAAKQIPVSSLDKFLQTTEGYDGARATLDRMRQAAKSLKTPGCTGAATSCDRYFASGETPSNIGLNMTNGLMTFVDGDYTLPPAGGAGLLVVTGTLTMNGNSDYKGLILVLGGGTVSRQGGGGDLSLCAMAVAKFGSSPGFLAPSFTVSGGGSSTIRYDSDWVRKALKSMGPGVLGVSEY